MRTLQKILHEGDEQILQLNIPQYLVYAAKRYCNYKTIVAAIEQSCDDVDVKFYLVTFWFLTPLLSLLKMMKLIDRYFDISRPIWDTWKRLTFHSE